MSVHLHEGGPLRAGRVGGLGRNLLKLADCDATGEHLEYIGEELELHLSYPTGRLLVS